MKKYISEFIGTAVLVLFGCGTAVLTGDLVATSLAFGLAIVAMAYAIGNISGCHVNPAVSLAMLISKKMSFKDFCFYVIAQILGALAGTALLVFIIKSMNIEGLTVAGIGLGANSFGDSTMTRLTLAGAFVVETILTFVFVFTILGVTSDEKKASIAGLVIGLALTFVHIIGIPLTGTSVNPARSLAPAIFLGGEALKQVWVFIVAPLVGATVAAIAFRLLGKSKKEAKAEEK